VIRNPNRGMQANFHLVAHSLATAAVAVAPNEVARTISTSTKQAHCGAVTAHEQSQR